MFETVDFGALGVALAVSGLALLIAWLVRRFAATDGAGLVVLVLLPLFAYGIASGDIAQITGPGGWGAQFREVAQDRIELAPIAEDIEELETIDKRGAPSLGRLKDVAPGGAIALTLELRRKGYYREELIAEYVRALLAFDPDLTVVFVDDERHFVGSSSAHSVLAALKLEREGGERRLVPAIEQADLLTLEEMLVLTTSSVTPETTNAEALEIMLEDGVESLVAVNDERRPVGVVRRDAIISRLMVKLASD